jgi:hypothetical protein
MVRYKHRQNIPPHEFAKTQKGLCAILEDITPMMPLQVTYLANLIPGTKNTHSIYLCKLTETPNHQEELYCIFQMQLDFKSQKEDIWVTRLRRACKALHTYLPKIANVLGTSITGLALYKASQMFSSNTHDKEEPWLVRFMQKVLVGDTSSASMHASLRELNNKDTKIISDTLLPVTTEPTAEKSATWKWANTAWNRRGMDGVVATPTKKGHFHGPVDATLTLESMQEQDSTRIMHMATSLSVIASHMLPGDKTDAVRREILKDTFTKFLVLGKYGVMFMVLICAMHVVKYIRNTPLALTNETLHSIHLCTPSHFSPQQLIKKGCYYVNPATNAVSEIVYVKKIVRDSAVSQPFDIKHKHLIDPSVEFHKTVATQSIRPIDTSNALLRDMYDTKPNSGKKNKIQAIAAAAVSVVKATATPSPKKGGTGEAEEDDMSPHDMYQPFPSAFDPLRVAISKAMPFAMDMASGDVATLDQGVVESMDKKLHFTNWWTHVVDPSSPELRSDDLPAWIPTPLLQINHHMHYVEDETIAIPVSTLVSRGTVTTVDEVPLARSIMSVEGTETLCVYSTQPLMLQKRVACLFAYHIRTSADTQRHFVALQHILMTHKKDADTQKTGLTLSANDLQNADTRAQQWYMLEIVSPAGGLEAALRALVQDTRPSDYVTYDRSTAFQDEKRTRHKIINYEVRTLPVREMVQQYGWLTKCEPYSTYSDAHEWSQQYYSRTKQAGGTTPLQILGTKLNLSNFLDVLFRILLSVSSTFVNAMVFKMTGVKNVVGPGFVGTGCLFVMLHRAGAIDLYASSYKFIIQPLTTMCMGAIKILGNVLGKQLLTLFKTTYTHTLAPLLKAAKTHVYDKLHAKVQPWYAKTKKKLPQWWKFGVEKRIVHLITGLLAAFFAMVIWLTPGQLERAADRNAIRVFEKEARGEEDTPNDALRDTGSELMQYVIDLVPFDILLNASFVPLTIGTVHLLRKTYNWTPQPTDITHLGVAAADAKKTTAKKGYHTDVAERDSRLQTARQKQQKRRAKKQSPPPAETVGLSSGSIEADVRVLQAAVSSVASPIDMNIPRPSVSEIEAVVTQLKTEVAHARKGDDKAVNALLQTTLSQPSYQPEIDTALHEMGEDYLAQQKRVKHNIKRLQATVRQSRNTLQSTTVLTPVQRTELHQTIDQHTMQLKALQLKKKELKLEQVAIQLEQKNAALSTAMLASASASAPM